MRRLIQALVLAALLVGLPASAAGQILVSSPAGGAGAISIDGVPVANQVAIWFDGNTLEGDADFTFDGLNVLVTGTLFSGNLSEPNTDTLVVGSDADGNTSDTSVFIGRDAGGSGNSTGADNVFIGFRAGEDNTSGTLQVAIGTNAMANATNGQGSIAIGFNAGVNWTTDAAANVAIGRDVGATLTSGDQNILLGQFADVDVGNANNRLAIGLNSIATADNQAVIGTKAGLSNGYTSMFLGQGVTAVDPAAFSLNVAGGSGMDNASADWTFGGGRGTGTGTGGHLIFRTAPAGGSSSTLNALVTALDIDDQQLLNVPVGINLANEVEIFAEDGVGFSDQVFKQDVTSTGQWSSSTLPDNWNLDGAIQSGLNFAGPDGAKTEINTDRTVVNSSTGATLTCSACIKAGTMVIGVSTFVRTSLGVTNGLTDYQIGLAADPDRWGAASGIVANDNSDGEDYTVLTTLIFTTDTDIILTGNGDGGDEFDGTGVITVVVHYWDMIAPTI